MSLSDNPGPDDEFFAHMKEQLQDIEVPDDLLNVQKMTDLEIASALSKVRQELLDMGEMLNVRTEKGRDLHSRRTALMIEMNKRMPPGPNPG